MRARFTMEAGLALASAGLLGLTLAWPDWIEALLHVDPDAGSGALEWLVVAMLAVATAAFAARAGARWRAHLA